MKNTNRHLKHLQADFFLVEKNLPSLQGPFSSWETTGRTHLILENLAPWLLKIFADALSCVIGRLTALAIFQLLPTQSPQSESHELLSCMNTDTFNQYFTID